MTINDITRAVSGITCDYVTEDRRPESPEDGHRVFTVEGLYEDFFVELRFTLADDTRPLALRAGIFKGEEKGTVLAFDSTPDKQGLELLTRWLRAMLALEM